MRAPARRFIAQLPSRKRTTLIMLFCVMCGGVLAGGSAAA